MPSLEISINCLCVLVPNPRQGIVHVLMPPTEGHDEHVVRAIHDNSVAEGISIEGWALTLGGRPTPVETSLAPHHVPAKGETLVDLSDIAGLVDPALIKDDAFPHVAARIDLRAGYMQRLHSEARWKLKGRGKVAMAHRVDWKIDDISDADLEWKDMAGGRTAPPFANLAALGGGNALRLDVYHVTEDALPPRATGTLSPQAVQMHFMAFYDMFGHVPATNEFPTDPERLADLETVIGELARAARNQRDPAAVDRLAELAEQLAAERGANRFKRTPSLRTAFRRVDKYNCPTVKGRLQ